MKIKRERKDEAKKRKISISSKIISMKKKYRNEYHIKNQSYQSKQQQ